MGLPSGNRKRIYRVLIKYVDEAIEKVSDFDHLDVAQNWCRKADRSNGQTYGIQGIWL